MADNSHSGLLLPGHEPTPPNSCNFPAGQLVFFGGTTSRVTGFPVTIVAAGTTPELIIGKHGQGVYLALLRLFDASGHQIAKIEGNQYWVDPSVWANRPTSNTLVIENGSGEEILRLVYLNPNAIKVNGVFNYVGRPSVTATDGLTTVGDGRFVNVCTNGTATVYQIG